MTGQDISDLGVDGKAEHHATSEDGPRVSLQHQLRRLDAAIGNAGTTGIAVLGANGHGGEVSARHVESSGDVRDRLQLAVELGEVVVARRRAFEEFEATDREGIRSLVMHQPGRRLPGVLAIGTRPRFAFNAHGRRRYR